MFSTFKPSVTTIKQECATPAMKPLEFISKLDTNELRQLEVKRQLQFFTFGPIQGSDRGNTLLLLAIAWNHLSAAEQLISFDNEKVALNIADTSETGKNTPLLLAAKTNATDIAIKLIGLGANVNHQDYNDDTPLHYACRYRNDKLITALIEKGADVCVKNTFGHTPYHYYDTKIVPEALEYSYGSINNLLRYTADSKKDFQATREKQFSNFRWYIFHIMMNSDIGHDITYMAKNGTYTLNEWARMHLSAHKNIGNAILYKLVMQCFCETRPAINPTILEKLQPIATSIKHKHDKITLPTYQTSCRMM